MQAMEFMTKNEIYYENKLLIGREKRKLSFNQWTYIFENDIEINGPSFGRGTKIWIKCNGSDKFYERRFKEVWFEKEWFSQSFQSSGDKNGNGLMLNLKRLLLRRKKKRKESLII
jgi:hypothetical protein